MKFFCSKLDDLFTLSIDGKLKVKIANLSFLNIGNLSKTNFNMFCNNIAKLKNIQTLNLGFNRLNILDVKKLHKLANIIASYQNLENLDLGFNELGSIDGKKLNILFGTLVNCKNLKNLNLSWNNIHSLNDLMIRDLCNKISDYKNLKELNLDGVHQGNEILKSLQKLIFMRQKGRLAADIIANIELFKNYNFIRKYKEHSDKNLKDAILILAGLPNELLMTIIALAVDCNQEHIKDFNIAQTYKTLEPNFKKSQILYSYKERLKNQALNLGYYNLKEQICMSFKSPESKMVLRAFNDFKVKELTYKAETMNSPFKLQHGLFLQ